MQLVWAERSQPITGGFIASVLFHVMLALLIVLGIPSFFKTDIPPTPEGISATIVSTITAAPKVDKLGKPDDKPKPQTPPAPEVKKPEPPKPAPPATPTPAAAPPPEAAQKVVNVPDETKAIEPKKDEQKPEDKKKPDDKPKPKKDNQQSAMDALLNNLTKQQPAPDTKDKTKAKAQPAPAQPTVGQQASLVNDVPMTASEEDAIRAAIEKNWNPPIGMANIDSYVILLRLYVNPDGTVSKTELIDPNLSDPGYLTLSDSARRAVNLTVASLGRLPIPADKSYPTIVLRWDMKEVCAELGC